MKSDKKNLSEKPQSMILGTVGGIDLENIKAGADTSNNGLPEVGCFCSCRCSEYPEQPDFSTGMNGSYDLGGILHSFNDIRVIYSSITTICCM